MGTCLEVVDGEEGKVGLLASVSDEIHVYLPKMIVKRGQGTVRRREGICQMGQVDAWPREAKEGRARNNFLSFMLSAG